MYATGSVGILCLIPRHTEDVQKSEQCDEISGFLLSTKALNLENTFAYLGKKET